MVKIKYINISLIIIGIVSCLFYFAFIKESFKINESIIEYSIEMSCSKTDNSTYDKKYEYLILCVDKDGKKIKARTRQYENIPWRDIDAKKCKLVKHKKEKNYLSFNPISFKFKKISKDISNRSNDKIEYKNKPGN